MQQGWFLSYHTPDEPLAKRLKTAIEEKNQSLRVFFAPQHLRAGRSWSAQLAAEIAVGIWHAVCNGCGTPWDNQRPAPVGSFAPNNFGLYDMVGNVWQWTQDCWHPNYNSAPTDGSSWVETACLNRVVRGGSYVSLRSYVESAGRFGYPSDVRFDSIGFRVARTLIP